MDNKKIKKTTKPSKIEKKPPKHPKRKSDPDCIYSWNGWKLTEGKAWAVREKLWAWWLKNKDIKKTLRDFFLEEELDRDEYSQLVAKFPFLKKTHLEVKYWLGMSLWERCVEGKWNWNAARGKIHLYGEEHKDALKFETEQKARATTDAIAASLKDAQEAKERLAEKWRSRSVKLNGK